MTAARRRGAAGFTLVEMMVVVSIIGVLVVMAYPLLKARPRAIDIAEQLSARLAEASRKAIAGGAVRPNVIAHVGVTARTRVVVEVGPDLRVVIATERLEETLPESSNNANWRELRRQVLPREIRVVGWSDTPSLSATAGPATLLSANQTKDIYCQPDGRCDGIMLYLRTTDGKTKARVVVLPLGGTPVTFTSW